MFREAAAEARRTKASRPDQAAYHEGREVAYVEALMLMQSQADAFMMSRQALGMADFDPLNDVLEPPKPSRSGQGPVT